MGEVEKKKEMWESGIPVGSCGWDGCFRLGVREVIVQLGPERPGGAVCHMGRGWAAGIGLEDTVQPGAGASWAAGRMPRAEVRAGAHGLRWHWGGGALAPGGVTAGEGTACH